MDGSQYVDMGGYGFDIKSSNEECSEYLKNEERTWKTRRPGEGEGVKSNHCNY